MSSALGSSVYVRGERWTVVGCERFSTCSVFVVSGAERDNAGRRCQFVEPFDRLRGVRPDRLRHRKRQAVLRTALAAATRAKPAGGLWTAADANLTLLPYQLEPALAVLDGATRILLADEVGLGKTIQAGLILGELAARGLVDRALILTPAGLRDTWAGELRDRFGLQVRVLDQAVIAQQTAALPAGFNPWTLKGITIASLDFAKRPEVLAAIEEAPLDLVIADEAHHLTPGSDRGAAVARLAVRVPWVVLVSATPHSGDEAAFSYLTGLGALGEGLSVFHRSRADVGIAVGRRVHWCAVAPQPVEAEMLRATERYARAIWQSRGASEQAVRLVATTLARRAASSAAALRRTLVRRLALLSGNDDPSPQQPPLPWDDVDGSDDDDPAWLGCAGLENGADERQRLEELIRLAQSAEPHSSKTHRLVRLLGLAREPAVIFTEYRDTLEALQQVLEAGRSIAVIHGGLAPALRQLAVDRFTRGSADVLIATDAAGEGLNLHQRCRLVVNVELPWNPLRLEQRIGRVDRIGQSRRVHAVHLFHRNSIEETVLARLERRRQTAGAWMSEEDIAQAALGAAPATTRPAPRIRTTSVSRAAAEVARADEQRRLRAPLRDAAAADASWALPRRQAATLRVVLLHVVRLLDGGFRTTTVWCLPISVHLARAPRCKKQWRIAIQALARDEVIRRTCSIEGERCAAAAARALRPLVDALVKRVERIRRRLTPARLPLRQVSLFDRRLEREAESRRHVRLTLDAHLEERARQFSGIVANPARFTVRLVAAWAADGPQMNADTESSDGAHEEPAGRQ
ncbi:MAG: helicase-related protein [Vicinamibacterales bacterium]